MILLIYETLYTVLLSWFCTLSYTFTGHFIYTNGKQNFIHTRGNFNECKSDISQKLYLYNINRIQQQVYQLQNTYEEVSKAQG